MADLGGYRQDMTDDDSPLRVVIAGGGVGALELLLALRHMADERVDLTLVSADTELRYRPASVAVPFGRGELYHYPLADIADAAAARLVHATARAVDTSEQRLFTDAGAVDYDVLAIATGATRGAVMDGAIAFRGDQDIAAIEQLLADIGSADVKHVVFAIPRGASWTLPLYELALLTAHHVAEQGILGVSVDLVTPEEHPLAQFGGPVSEAVAQLLREHRVTLHTATYPVALSGQELDVLPHGVIPADRVICIPPACGTAVPGLPSNAQGFLAVDEVGRVIGADDLYAVGDVTTYPIKQGGIAAQQADVAAQSIAARAGAPVGQPAPFHPSLHGLLITGGEPRYLFAELGGGQGETATASTEPLWWPGGKVAARYLGPYLAQAPHEVVRSGQ